MMTMFEALKKVMPSTRVILYILLIDAVASLFVGLAVVMARASEFRPDQCYDRPHHAHFRDFREQRRWHDECACGGGGWSNGATPISVLGSLQGGLGFGTVGQEAGVGFGTGLAVGGTGGQFQVESGAFTTDGRHDHGVPGPIVGAGLPGLVAGASFLLWLARNRKSR